MSYNIHIGELELETDPKSSFINLNVKGADHENAPDNGDLSGKSSSRYPGYGQMSDFCEKAGPEIKSLFYDEEEGFLRPHPGIKRILPKHLETIAKAIKDRNSTPEECYKLAKKIKDTGDENITDEEGVLFRLGWYYFWMKWALENCRVPAIRNS